MLRSTPVDPVPPISFQPIPVRDPIMKPEPPPPEVPPKPFDDTDVFEDVDQHAVEVNNPSVYVHRYISVLSPPISHSERTGWIFL
jgi:hypothetical protein